jgi:single-stranded-DNA-specific exonuclease
MVTVSPAMSGVSGRRWRLRGRFPDGNLADAPYEPLVRHLLWHRGILSADAAGMFMGASDPGHDPALLPDIGAAIQRLRKALAEGELVAVFGDFDVDGVTATAILAECLRDLGANVRTFIPNRFTDGYGLSTEAVEKIAANGAHLIICVDCGTSSLQEISRARELGVDVIVLDHHIVPPELPPTVALINPKRPDASYPEPELSSGGLAFRVMEVLYRDMGRDWDPDRYLDLAALSTVCDMAPLRGENRWLVREGLRALSRTQRPGIRALLEAASCDPERVSAETIGYAIGPRLNAAGRLADAGLALDLLLERDEARARELALELSCLNQQRREQTGRSLALARSLLEAEDPGAPLIFVGHADIPSGIVGIVAGNLLEQFNRPAVVYQAGDEFSRGSCRSIPEFDITGALRTCKELLVKFGGHRAAAGLTARNENVAAVKEALTRVAEEQLQGIDLHPVIDIDAAIPLERVGPRLLRPLKDMAPFGVANPDPVFLSRRVSILDSRLVGNDGAHLKLKLRAGKVTWPAIAFGLAGGAEQQIEAGQLLDVVYTFSADNGWDGAMELRVLDFAPSA